MLNHHFRSAYRSLLRHKSTFTINLLSLTVGLSCAIFIFLWVNDEWQVDKFHRHDAELFQVMKHAQYSEGVQTKFHTMGPLAETLKRELPEVQRAATVVYWFTEFDLAVNEKNTTAAGYYAGVDFLDMFSFNLEGGTAAEVFKDLNNVALSREAAIKLFGTAEAAMGQTVELNRNESFKVTGLFDVPERSTQQFDFVLSFEKFKQDPRFGARMENWNSHGPKTFVQLQPSANLTAVEAKMNEIIHTRADADHITFFFKPFSEQYLYAQYEAGKLVGGRIDYVQLFGVIGLFILAIACINFINLATARASLRAKEVSIKKMMGAKRSSLITQYLAEALVITSLALVIAVGIVYLFLPDFNTLTGKTIALSFSPTWMLAGLGLVGITGLLAGTYPAFYLSAIQPIKGIKGFMQRSWQELMIRKGLVVFQFSIAIGLIISVLVISQQMDYLQNKSLGYDRSHLVSFLMNIRDHEKLNAFVKEARKLPGVENISSGNSPINHCNRTTNISWDGKDPASDISFYFFNAAEGLTETLGFEFLQGRSFSPEFGNETEKVILNETAVATIG
ncbi:MAG: ABC transporter permease, partial [Saprospiraceae bacterium]